MNASTVGEPQKPISAATPGGALSTAVGFRARIDSIGVSTSAATTAEIAKPTPTSHRVLAYCGAIATARTDVENGTGQVSALHDKEQPPSWHHPQNSMAWHDVQSTASPQP